LGSSDTVERRAERVDVRQFIDGAARNAERLAQHGAVRNLWDAVRNLWDYRGLTPPSKVLVKIGIERYGRKASGTGRALPFHQRRRLHAERLAHHLHRDPLGAVRILWDYRGLKPFSKLLVKIGIERHGRKASGTGRGPPIYRGRRQHAKRLAPHLQRDPIGAVRNRWDY
jgi:hypothetical protein